MKFLWHTLCWYPFCLVVWTGLVQGSSGGGNVVVGEVPTGAGAVTLHFPFHSPVWRIQKMLDEVIDRDIPTGVAATEPLFQKIHNAISSLSFSPEERQWLLNLCDPLWLENKYTRIQLAHRPNRYNLLELCWSANSTSPVHSHGGHVGVESQCFIKVLDGIFRETVFEMPKDDDETLVPIREAFATKNDVTFMNDGVGIHEIHSFVNTVTLHFYIPGYSQCYAMPRDKIDRTIHTIHYQAKWDDAGHNLIMLEPQAVFTDTNNECTY